MNCGWLQYFTRAFQYTVLKYRLQKHVRTIHTKSGKWRLSQDFDLEIGKKAVQQHKKLTIHTPEKLLKFDPKRRVSKVTIDKQDYVVKEFVNASSRWVFSHDRKNWANGFVLQELGFSVCKYFAWLKNAKDAYIVMEYINGENLFAKINNSDLLQTNLNLVYDAVRLIAKLHDSGIYHRDLKPENWVVSTDNDLFLIDLEDVSFTRKISDKYAKKALLQLLARPDKMSFYRDILINEYFERRVG